MQSGQVPYLYILKFHSLRLHSFGLSLSVTGHRLTGALGSKLEAFFPACTAHPPVVDGSLSPEEEGNRGTSSLPPVLFPYHRWAVIFSSFCPIFAYFVFNGLWHCSCIILVFFCFFLINIPDFRCDNWLSVFLFELCDCDVNRVLNGLLLSNVES